MVEHRRGTDLGRPDLAHAVDAVATLVALRSLDRVALPREVRATVLLERPRGGWAREDRSRLVDAASAPAVALVEGERIEEPLAASRWLAWFPRPLGPHHAVGMASPAVDWLAARCPQLRLVRMHVALRSWQAEAVQAMGNLGRTTRGSAWLQRWVARGGPLGDLPDGPAARWACVVEVVGAEDLLVRGWAHGADRPGLAALLADGRADVATGGPAADALDSLAGDEALRWSVADPAPIGG